MAKMDDFLQNLQKMDPKQLRSLVRQAAKNLSPDQQKKLGKVMGDPAKLASLKEKISDQDLEGLSAHMKSGKSLEEYIKQGDIQKRINELL